MEKVNLFICEDDCSFIEAISTVLLKETITKGCDSTDNVKECIFLYKKQTSCTILLDIVLTNTYCADDLEQIKGKINIESKVIIVTSCSSECLLENSSESIKDFALEKLACVHSLIEKFDNVNRKSPYFENNIKLLLLKLCIPIDNLGFIYMTEGIFYINNEKPILSITKDIYPHIAKIYATSAANVEKNIRDAISSAYKKNQEAFLEELSLNQKPKNNLFLRLVVEKLKKNL